MNRKNRPQIRSTTVLAKLAEEDMRFFTVDDLQRVLNVDRGRARLVAQRLADAGFARRLQRGLYALLDPAAWLDPKGGFVSGRYGAAAVLAPKPYYLAYYSAMDLHGMLGHPLLSVIVATRVQKNAITISPVRFQFVKLSDRRFFGFEQRSVEGGSQANVADLERTFVDCVDRFDLCGGVGEVAAGFEHSGRSLNPDKLVQYLERLSEPSLAKRLGYLLEEVDVAPTRLLRQLEVVSRRSSRFVPLDPRADVPQEAVRDSRWKLILNADTGRSGIGSWQ
jgi:Predicted transcriptional regulator